MTGGRPSKLTPERQAKIVDAIRAGNYYDTASGMAGVDYSTFRRWMINGEEQTTGKYHEFYNAVKKAEHEAEVRMVTQWQRQMPDDWKAIATFLERRYPKKWGKQVIDHNVEGNVNVNVNVKGSKDDER